MSNLSDFSFNFDEAEAPKGMDPIPDGVYDFVLVEATVQPIQNNTNRMISVQLQVEGGEYSNRVVFDNWFIPNKATQDPEKFKQSLGFLQQRLEAFYGTSITGNFKIDPRDLPGRRAKAQVRVARDPKPAEQGGGFYEPKNVVRRYFPLSSTPAQQAQSFQPQTAQGTAPQQYVPSPQNGEQQAPVQQPQPQPVSSGEGGNPNTFRL